MEIDWINLVIVLIFAGGIALGIKRGFGKSIFDFAAGLITVRIAATLHPLLAHRITILSSPQANSALIYAGVFMLLGAAVWLVSKVAYESTLISLDTFDPPLGGIVGIFIAVILAHAFTKTYFIAANQSGQMPPALAQSILGAELYGFTTYHNVIGFLKGLTG